jgi:transposase
MGQGSPLSAESKQLIVLLKSYFDRTRPGTHEPCTAVEQVARAMNIGVVTVRRVMAEYNRDPLLLHKVHASKGRPPRVLPDAVHSTVRTYVREANFHGRHITLEMLGEHLRQQATVDQDFSIRTLGRALERWGFIFGKGTRSQRLKEKDHVVAARQCYLRKKRANRNGEGVRRPEVYLDESYVNKNHSNDLIWYSDEDGPWVQKPTGKGERLVILNAITASGWVPHARLVFKSTKKTGDYHGQMNHGIFAKWFTEQLLPNIPERSIIIMDNAAYHNTLDPSSAPTAACSKDKMQCWLQNNGVSLPEDCLKVEMVETLKKMDPSPTYALDVLAAKHGHDILRTPPYHPELQPIEICWGIVKNHVARNCDFTMATLLTQLDLAFERVTSNTCVGLIAKIREVEDRFWKEDLLQDLRDSVESSIPICEARRGLSRAEELRAHSL